MNQVPIFPLGQAPPTGETTLTHIPKATTTDITTVFEIPHTVGSLKESILNGKNNVSNGNFQSSLTSLNKEPKTQINVPNVPALASNIRKGLIRPIVTTGSKPINQKGNHKASEPGKSDNSIPIGKTNNTELPSASKNKFTGINKVTQAARLTPELPVTRKQTATNKINILKGKEWGSFPVSNIHSKRPASNNSAIPKSNSSLESFSPGKPRLPNLPKGTSKIINQKSAKFVKMSASSENLVQLQPMPGNLLKGNSARLLSVSLHLSDNLPTNTVDVGRKEENSSKMDLNTYKGSKLTASLSGIEELDAAERPIKLTKSSKIFVSRNQGERKALSITENRNYLNKSRVPRQASLNTHTNGSKILPVGDVKYSIPSTKLTPIKSHSKSFPGKNNYSIKYFSEKNSPASLSSGKPHTSVNKRSPSNLENKLRSSNQSGPSEKGTTAQGIDDLLLITSPNTKAINIPKKNEESAKKSNLKLSDSIRIPDKNPKVAQTSSVLRNNNDCLSTESTGDSKIINRPSDSTGSTIGQVQNSLPVPDKSSIKTFSIGSQVSSFIQKIFKETKTINGSKKETIARNKASTNKENNSNVKAGNNIIAKQGTENFQKIRKISSSQKSLEVLKYTAKNIPVKKVALATETTTLKILIKNNKANSSTILKESKKDSIPHENTLSESISFRKELETIINTTSGSLVTASSSPTKNIGANKTNLKSSESIQKENGNAGIVKSSTRLKNMSGKASETVSDVIASKNTQQVVKGGTHSEIFIANGTSSGRSKANEYKLLSNKENSTISNRAVGITNSFEKLTTIPEINTQFVRKGSVNSSDNKSLGKESISEAKSGTGESIKDSAGKLTPNQGINSSTLNLSQVNAGEKYIPLTETDFSEDKQTYQASTRSNGKFLGGSTSNPLTKVNVYGVNTKLGISEQETIPALILSGNNRNNHLPEKNAPISPQKTNSGNLSNSSNHSPLTITNGALRNTDNRVDSVDSIVKVIVPKTKKTIESKAPVKTKLNKGKFRQSGNSSLEFRTGKEIFADNKGSGKSVVLNLDPTVKEIKLIGNQNTQNSGQIPLANSSTVEKNLVNGPRPSESAGKVIIADPEVNSIHPKKQVISINRPLESSLKKSNSHKLHKMMKGDKSGEIRQINREQKPENTTIPSRSANNAEKYLKSPHNDRVGGELQSSKIKLVTGKEGSTGDLTSTNQGKINLASSVVEGKAVQAFHKSVTPVAGQETILPKQTISKAVETEKATHFRSTEEKSPEIAAKVGENSSSRQKLSADPQKSFRTISEVSRTNSDISVNQKEIISGELSSVFNRTKDEAIVPGFLKNLLVIEIEKLIKAGKTTGTTDALKRNIMSATQLESRARVKIRPLGASSSRNSLPLFSKPVGKQTLGTMQGSGGDNLPGGRQSFKENFELIQHEEAAIGSTISSGDRGFASAVKFTEGAGNSQNSHSSAPNLSEPILKMIERLRQSRNSSIKMSLTLSGGRSMTMKLLVRPGQVQAQFFTDSIEIQQGLSQGWDKIAKAAAEQGIHLASPKIEFRPKLSRLQTSVNRLKNEINHTEDTKDSQVLFSEDSHDNQGSRQHRRDKALNRDGLTQWA